jgi:hypothetical protein
MKKLVAASLMVLGVGMASAQEQRVVVKVNDPNFTAYLATKYGLTLKGTTSDGKRSVMEAQTVAMAAFYANLMSYDPMVDKVAVNKNLNLGGQSGKGSTIPIIGVDPQVESRNTMQMSQMNYNGTTPTGRNVKVAVLDTGLAASQTALWSRTVGSYNFVTPGQSSYDVAANIDSDGDGKFDECVGHGSLVTALISATAPNTEFLQYKVADSDGAANAWTIIQAVDAAMQAGAEVINISLGAVESNPVVTDIFNQADAANITVVAAIGNNQLNQALFPSNQNKAICVTGIDLMNKKDTFSNWNTTADVAAPNSGSVVAADGTVKPWAGTSFATALVTGSIADALRRTGPKTASSIRTALVTSGANINAANPSFVNMLGTKLNIAGFEAMLIGMP